MWVEFDLFELWIEFVDVMVEFGVVFKECIVVFWIKNEYGIGMGYLSFVYCVFVKVWVGNC